jgi:hypothetical protein
MNVGIGNEAAQFHSWEYLFRIFDTVSLQCTQPMSLKSKVHCKTQSMKRNGINFRERTGFGVVGKLTGLPASRTLPPPPLPG